MKEKRGVSAIATVLAALMMAVTAFASGEAVAVTDRKLPGGAVPVSGTLPSIQISGDKELERRLNSVVTAFYNDMVFAAYDDGRVLPVTFSHRETGDEKYCSVLYFADHFYGNTSAQTVRSMVLDRQSGKRRALTDFLGRGAYDKATELVRETIKNNPGQYLEEAGAVTVDKDTAFYVNNKSEIVLVFEKYAIAPGASGTPEIVVGTVA